MKTRLSNTERKEYEGGRDRGGLEKEQQASVFTFEQFELVLENVQVLEPKLIHNNTSQ